MDWRRLFVRGETVDPRFNDPADFRRESGLVPLLVLVAVMAVLGAAAALLGYLVLGT